MLNKVGKEGTFVQGMRVTDGETMDIVEMVLGGHVNKDIVSLLNQNGGKAVGITGRDSHFIKAKKLFINTPERNGVDIGQVGVVESIDCSLIKGMVERGYIPVVAPIGVGRQGEAFNINADLVAGKLAEELNAEKLVMMTNITGVMDKEGNLLTNLTPRRIDDLVADGTLYGGMLPKIACALDAVRAGVKAARRSSSRARSCSSCVLGASPVLIIIMIRPILQFECFHSCKCRWMRRFSWILRQSAGRLSRNA